MKRTGPIAPHMRSSLLVRSSRKAITKLSAYCSASRSARGVLCHPSSPSPRLFCGRPPGPDPRRTTEPRLCGCRPRCHQTIATSSPMVGMDDVVERIEVAAVPNVDVAKGDRLVDIGHVESPPFDRLRGRSRSDQSGGTDAPEP